MRQLPGLLAEPGMRFLAESPRPETLGPSLAARLQAGSAAALGEAYDLYHQPLRAFAQRLIGDTGAAEDLVQETFIALGSAIRSYDGTCSLKTFITAVAANHARHHVRAAARRRAAMQRYGAETELHAAVSPEEQVGSRQLAHELSRLLDQLPLEQRIAFVLCEVEERSSSEAAQIVGVPAATVRTRLWYAKRKLRQTLARGDVR